MPAVHAEVGEAIRELRRQIEEKALLLSDLEVVLEDCQRKRQMLLQDLRVLRERLWDLRDTPAAHTSTRQLG